MKKTWLLIAVLLFAANLFAHVNTYEHLNLDQSVKQKLIDFQSDDNEILPIYLSSNKR